MDVKITSVIIGVILGGLIGSVGYWFKSRSEVKGKINNALFHLLEVWTIIGVAKLINEEKFSNQLIIEIKKSFPKENITSQIEAEIKDGLERSIPIWLGIKPENGEQFQNKYLSAVTELAPIDPFYAFQLSRNQMVINFLDGFDVLVEGKELAESDKLIIKNMKSFLSNDAFDEFQVDLKKLSKKSGVINYWRVNRHIKKINNRVDNIPKNAFKSYIEKVIAPGIQAHYDSLGVKNPNLV